MVETDKDIKFLSTLSLRRATWTRPIVVIGGGDFYPRSPCGERHLDTEHMLMCSYISIHALLAESDMKKTITIDGREVFLSTLSLRRATGYFGRTFRLF